MNVISTSARPVIAHGLRLQWEPAQQAHVLLYPEGMIKLNSSAGEIMKRCDGKRTLSDITADLEQAFSATGLAKDVEAFVTMAMDKHWLEIQP
jgi:pyrroloquinoline quinone biosynthesis protein D